MLLELWQFFLQCFFSFAAAVSLSSLPMIELSGYGASLVGAVYYKVLPVLYADLQDAQVSLADVSKAQLWVANASPASPQFSVDLI